MSGVVKTMCPDCGGLTDAPVAGRCESCAPDHLARDNARRMAHPRREVYDDPRWRATRAAVLERDRFICQGCGRHRAELGPNETLLADHVGGFGALAARGGDVFDPDECQALCSSCSGETDGGRR